MRQIWIAALGLWLGASAGAFAQSNGNGPVVVELYTSQGCSSCPPADAILAELAERDDVIALGLHVDYWDYIGWKDKFADPAYSQRQRSYARAAGARTVYTPQMIVQGAEHLVGSHPGKLDKLLRQFSARETGVVLQLQRQGGEITLQATSSGKLPKGTLVQLVRFHPRSRVEITRGENAGRTIEYANVVTSLKRINQWDGGKDLRMRIRTTGPDPVVVIIQEPGPGRILAAAELR